MSFNIAFIGGSPGSRFVERRSNRAMGQSFPPTKVKDLLNSIAVDSGRTLLGDTTSSVSGGATVSLVRGAAALQLTNTLRDAIRLRLIEGSGSMLVTAKKSRLIRTDRIDQKSFTFRRGMVGPELGALVDFLGDNDLAAIGPYGDLIELFTTFSRRCRTGNFITQVEFET